MQKPKQVRKEKVTTTSNHNGLKAGCVGKGYTTRRINGAIGKLESIPQNLWEAPPLPEYQNYDPLKAYAARRLILESFPETEPSRIDALIALYMRENGFSRETI